LRLLERSIRVGFWHGDTDKRNQTLAGRKDGGEIYKPVSKPPLEGVQGLSNVDCVAV
jgi:hypothetical protein